MGGSPYEEAHPLPLLVLLVSGPLRPTDEQEKQQRWASVLVRFTSCRAEVMVTSPCPLVAPFQKKKLDTRLLCTMQEIDTPSDP